MTNLRNNVKTRFVSIFTIVCLFIALNASGALAGFWRTINNTFNNMTSGDQVNFSYGYGYGSLGWGYGYGYGYGYGSSASGYYYSSDRTGSSAYENAQEVTGSNISSVASLSGSNIIINVGTKLTAGNVSVTLPAGLEIRASSGTLASILSQISVSTGSVSGYVGKTDFGISGTKLYFSKPVKLEIAVSGVSNGDTLDLLVKHYGDSSYNTVGLTNINGVCNSDGSASPSVTTAIVSSGKVTLYTCSASEFVTKTQTSSGGGSGGSSGGGGGGGGSSLTKDNCPKGDTSGNLYDGKCEKTTTTTTGSGSGSGSGNTTTTDDTTGANDTTGTDDTAGDDISLDDLLGDDYVKTSDDGKVTITKTDGTEVTFSDINNTFAKDYIAKLAALGIVNGYEDGTFRPEKTASRAEYLKMVLRAMNVDYSDADTSKLTFVDVDKDSWIAKVVVKAVELNMIDGSNKNFRPNDNISRAESMKMLINAAGVEVVESNTSDFADVNGWATKYVQKAKELGIVNGQEVNGKLIFRPFDSITRAEVSKIVVKTMELK